MLRVTSKKIWIVFSVKQNISGDNVKIPLCLTETRKEAELIAVCLGKTQQPDNFYFFQAGETGSIYTLVDKVKTAYFASTDGLSLINEF
jgi:hypothetical protein